MANILLVDDSDIAARAMRGIVERRHHRLAVARSGKEAWQLLRDAVKIDLLFLELKLPGENGTHLLQRLRKDCLFKQLPLVVYSASSRKFRHEPASLNLAS